jgi:hypothetical protein
MAENLFLRKQLVLFQERKARPRRTTASYRLAMVVPAKFFAWRDALLIVKPETLVKWHRTAFKMFWRWKSRKPGRPALPRNLRELVVPMARENPTCGEEWIASELSLKLGTRVSPRTVGKYLKRNPRGRLRAAVDDPCAQSCTGIFTCDFFVSVTSSFRVPYVFVAMEIGSRRILHVNVTEHPTAEWTIQQFREFLAYDHPYRFVIHDRDKFFSSLPGLRPEGFRCARPENASEGT